MKTDHSSPTTPVALTAQDHIEQTLNLLHNFTALLEQETAAAKKCDFKRMDQLQNQKKEFASQYKELAALLHSSKEEIITLPLDLREKLVRQRTDFTTALNDNLQALDHLKNNSQRLADRILNAARRALVDDMESNYAADGRNAAYGRSKLSMALDRSL